MGQAFYFDKIGRQKKTWTAKCETNGDILKELKKELLSKDIEFFETEESGIYLVLAGMRPVGKFYEVNDV